MLGDQTTLHAFDHLTSIPLAHKENAQTKTCQVLFQINSFPSSLQHFISLQYISETMYFLATLYASWKIDLFSHMYNKLHHLIQCLLCYSIPQPSRPHDQFSSLSEGIFGLIRQVAHEGEWKHLGSSKSVKTPWIQLFLHTFNSPSMPSPAFAPPVALPFAQQFPLPMPATQNFWCHSTATLDVSATCLVLALLARSPYPLRQQHRWKVMCNCSSWNTPLNCEDFTWWCWWCRASLSPTYPYWNVGLQQHPGKRLAANRTLAGWIRQNWKYSALPTHLNLWIQKSEDGVMELERNLARSGDDI